MYAIYNGDEFVDVGTADELSERMGIQKTSLISLASKTRNGKLNYNRLNAYHIKGAI